MKILPINNYNYQNKQNQTNFQARMLNLYGRTCLPAEILGKITKVVDGSVTTIKLYHILERNPDDVLISNTTTNRMGTANEFYEKLVKAVHDAKYTNDPKPVEFYG